MEMLNRCIEHDAYARDFVKKMTEPAEEPQPAEERRFHVVLPEGTNRAARRAEAKRTRAANRNAARNSQKASTR